MAALGYSANKVPFQELAERLPLTVLEAIAGDTVFDDNYLLHLQALLFGTAGLLPFQRPDHYGQMTDDPYLMDLESRWQA
jgi:hypothetical protein